MPRRVPEKFDELAHAAGVAGGGAALVPWLRSLKAEIGIAAGPGRGRRAARSRSRAWSRSRCADICHQTNPRPCTGADFERLFGEAM